MGIFDDVVESITQIPRTIDNFFQGATNPETDGEQASDVLADLIEDLQPADELAAALVDLTEELVESDLEQAGQLTPENVEAVLDQAEGAGAGLYLGLASINTVLEGASVGQLDAQEEFLVQAAAIFAYQDLVGRELEARLQEGVDPALQAQVRKRHRSRFAALEDFVEGNLRSKRVAADLDPEDMTVPDEVKALFAPDDFGWLTDPDVYGLRPDQTDLLEFVSLAHLEPEEILEEAPQKGVIPSQEAMLQALELSGQPQDVKQVFKATRDAIPESQDIYQEKTRVGEVIFEVDRKVQAGVLTPDEAVSLVEQDIRQLVKTVDAAGSLPDGFSEAEDPAAVVLDELRRKWQLFRSLPADPPSPGDLQAWYEKGVIGGQQFQQLYSRFGNAAESFFFYLQESAIDKGAEDVQKQFALDRISASEARQQLSLMGYTEREVTQILQGANPEELWRQNLTEADSAEVLDVALAEEIGDGRGAVLRSVGIATLGDLAASAVEDLTAVTGMTDTEAQTAISSAQTILEQAAQG